MTQILIYAALALTGLCFGSFAGATVWRLRSKQLIEDEAAGEPVDDAELKRLKKLSGTKVKDDRSVCLSCGHTLRWYDLLPLVSWLSLRGRCRYCQARIGYMEPLVEISVAVFFVLSYLLWSVDIASGVEIAKFVLWLASGVGLAILFAYDAKWFLLPNIIMWPVIVLAAVYAGVSVVQSTDSTAQLTSLAVAIAVLSGLYWVLYYFSRWRYGEDGTWVGFGDVKLGLALALLLVDWRLAIMALFMANLIGCLLVLPGLATGKLDRKAHVPFGPLLIAGFLLAAFAGESVIEFYQTTFLF